MDEFSDHLVELEAEQTALEDHETEFEVQKEQRALCPATIAPVPLFITPGNFQSWPIGRGIFPLFGLMGDGCVAFHKGHERQRSL